MVYGSVVLTDTVLQIKAFYSQMMESTNMGEVVHEASMLAK